MFQLVGTLSTASHSFPTNGQGITDVVENVPTLSSERGSSLEGAKRLECARLAGAVAPPESGSQLAALQTLPRPTMPAPVPAAASRKSALLWIALAHSGFDFGMPPNSSNHPALPARGHPARFAPSCWHALDFARNPSPIPTQSGLEVRAPKLVAAEVTRLMPMRNSECGGRNENVRASSCRLPHLCHWLSKSITHE